jgi:hypothetical protein
MDGYLEFIIFNIGREESVVLNKGVCCDGDKWFDLI